MGWVFLTKICAGRAWVHQYFWDELASYFSLLAFVCLSSFIFLLRLLWYVFAVNFIILSPVIIAYFFCTENRWDPRFWNQAVGCWERRKSACTAINSAICTFRLMSMYFRRSVAHLNCSLHLTHHLVNKRKEKSKGMFLSIVKNYRITDTHIRYIFPSMYLLANHCHVLFFGWGLLTSTCPVRIARRKTLVLKKNTTDKNKAFISDNEFYVQL